MATPWKDRQWELPTLRSSSGLSTAEVRVVLLTNLRTCRSVLMTSQLTRVDAQICRRIIGAAKRSGLKAPWMIELLSDEDIHHLFPARGGKKAEMDMAAVWEDWKSGTSTFHTWLKYIRANRSASIYRYGDFCRRFADWRAQARPWLD